MNYEEGVNYVLKLKDEAKFNEAIIKLKCLVDEFPEKSVLYGLMALVYSLDDKFLEAIIYYRKCLSLNPKSEAASSGLFHALNSTNKADMALVEMKRYLSKYNSMKDNYKWILEDLLSDINDPLLKKYKVFILEQGEKYKLN